MDDNELDKLFGEEFVSGSKESSGDKVSEAVSEKDMDGDKEPSHEKEEGNPFVLKKEGPEEDTDEVFEAPYDESESDASDYGEDSEAEKSVEEAVEETVEEDVKDGSDKDRASEAEEDAQAPEKAEVPPAAKPSKPAKVTGKNVRRRKAPAEPKPQREVIHLSAKSIIAICFALALVVMVVLIIFLPAFRVRIAHVEGNVVISDQQLLREAGLEYDAHLMSGISGNIFDILRLDYGKTEERIKKENPYIEDIRITIRLPSTVDITVKERSKVCYIKTPDGYAALDKDGIVLELSSFESGRKVQPVICGLNIKYLELGRKIKISNINDYKKSIIVLGAILAADNASIGDDYSMFENTSEVRVLPSGYIFLTVYSPSGSLIQIKLNSLESISDDMAWLLYAINSDTFEKIAVDGALDLTNDEFIFREY